MCIVEHSCLYKETGAYYVVSDLPLTRSLFFFPSTSTFRLYNFNFEIPLTCTLRCPFIYNVPARRGGGLENLFLSLSQYILYVFPIAVSYYYHRVIKLRQGGDTPLNITKHLRTCANAIIFRFFAGLDSGKFREFSLESL